MNISHVGLVCRSEENCDRFYQGVLGLEKQKPRFLSVDIAVQLFGREHELKMLNYTGSGAHFEIFLSSESDYGDKGNAKRRVGHTCIEVGDIRLFLDRCRGEGVEVIEVAKGDKWITFVKDFDGNLFEIKERK